LEFIKYKKSKSWFLSTFFYLNMYQTTGLSIAPITAPRFTNTLGIVMPPKVSLVVHSGPRGSLRLRSYCARVSKGCGTLPTRYLTLFFARAAPS
ncbi:MAG: hypothetical protein Q9191_008562, partial [Dirinaria sp. TL-2023a]